MTAYSVTLNGAAKNVEADPDTPLLWVIRDSLGLTGTKYGCGVGQCGACTVHLDGTAVRSCRTPITAAAGRRVTTIEGLAAAHGRRLQDAWIAEQAPQCGYCQPGQLMSAAFLLARRADPTDAEIDAAMSGNLCRCGAYTRIRKAIRRAAQARA